MLAKIRRSLVRNAAFMGSLATMFTLVACESSFTTPDQELARRAGVSAKSLDGKDYYTGIFFGDGPVAKAIPEIRDNYELSQAGFTDEEVAQARAQRDEILAIVDAYDPGIFSRLEFAIENGERLLIRDTLDEAGKVTLMAYLQTDQGRRALDQADDPETLAQVTQEVNDSGLHNEELTEQQLKEAVDEMRVAMETGELESVNLAALCLVLVFVVAVALLLILAGALLVVLVIAAALWAWLWVFSVREGGLLTDLQIEQMVDSLASTYGGSGQVEPQPYTPQFAN